MPKTRGAGLVAALAACSFFVPVAAQTPRPLPPVPAGVLTPVADLSLASARRAPGGVCIRGRMCALDVTIKNDSDNASPAVSVGIVDGRPEDEFDTLGVSILPRASRTRLVSVFVPADHPADALERTLELRLPNGRPYGDRSPERNRLTARFPIDVVDAQIFGVGGLPRGPVSAGTPVALTVRLKNAGTVVVNVRFREEGSGREASSEIVRLTPGEVRPVPWTLVVPERPPARFTPALVLSWVEVPLGGSGPLGGARFSTFESPRGNRFDLAIDVAPLPSFDLEVADLRVGAPLLTIHRIGEPARITGLETTTVLRNRGTETWGSSFMIGFVLSAGRPETSLRALWRMDFAAAGPIGVDARREVATRIASPRSGPLVGGVVTPELVLAAGQWYTLDVSIVSRDDLNAANNRARWVVLLGAGGRVAEMRRLP